MSKIILVTGAGGLSAGNSSNIWNSQGHKFAQLIGNR